MRKRFFFLLIPAFLFASSAWARVPNVVVSIPPIHSLVAGVLNGVAEPKLLMDGVSSPHVYQLTPSKRQMLSEAEMVFYLHPSFESFLNDAFRTLPLEIRTIALAKNKKLKLLPTRADGVWKHSEGDEDSDHVHSAKDYHLWLDPQNAIVMTRGIAAELSMRYPEYEAEFNRNAASVIKDLTLLDRQLVAALSSVRHKPFFVFHDGLQYLEKHYGLYGAGAIAMNLDTPLAAARLREVRNRIAETKSSCVFSEPQFSKRVIKAVTEGLFVKRVDIDILGTSLNPGTGLYRQMMSNLAGVIGSCLVAPIPIL